MRTGRRRVMAAAVVVMPLAVAAGCRSPTEVTLTVTTDVKCGDFSGAAIAVGTAADVETKAPATVTTSCSNSGSVGSLVIVPSGSEDDEITIRVAGGVDRDPTTCSDDGDLTGCIIARRSLRFEEHTALVVALALESACAGVKCAADQTCIAGSCLSDVGDPLDQGDGGPSSVSDATVPPGAEASAPPLDGAVSTDGATAGDGPPGPGGPVLFDAGPAPDATAPSPPCSDGTDTGAFWGSTRRCGTNDARSPYLGASNAIAGVSCATFGGGALTPLAVDSAGRVYLGGADGTLRLVDPNLNPLSSLSLGSAALTSAVITASGTFYVTSATAVYKLVVLEGTPVLESTLTLPQVMGTSALPNPAPVVTRDGTLVVGFPLVMSGYGGGFPGDSSWSFAPSAGATTSKPPLLAIGIAPDGTLLGSWNKLPLYAVGSSGAGASVSANAAPAGTLVGGLGHVYAWTKGGIAAIDGASTMTSVIVGVALQSNAVVVAYNPAQSGTAVGYIALLDPTSLATIQQATFSPIISSPPVVDADDNVYFLTIDGKLHVHKGQSAHTFDAGAPAATFPAPIIGDGSVYLGGIAGGSVCVYR